MKNKQSNIDAILKAAEELYIDLNHPRIGDGGILVLYEKFDRSTSEALLKEIFTYVSEDTDINDDRCIVYRVAKSGKTGMVYFSYIDSYVYIHNFMEFRELFETRNYNIIDQEEASRIVPADSDFFSYENEVQIFNILFSNYMISTLS